LAIEGFRPGRLAGLCLAVMASTTPVAAQAPPTRAQGVTPAQTQAIAAFKPHAEQACRALYVRPDAVETCLARVLDAALPLAAADPAAPNATVAPPPRASRSTVAPDGRE
jgi:hypothetical protein